MSKLGLEVAGIALKIPRRHDNHHPLTTESHTRFFDFFKEKMSGRLHLLDHAAIKQHSNNNHNQ